VHLACVRAHYFSIARNLRPGGPRLPILQESNRVLHVRERERERESLISLVFGRFYHVSGPVAAPSRLPSRREVAAEVERSDRARDITRRIPSGCILLPL